MSWPIDDVSLALLASLDVAAMPSTCRIGRRTKSVASGRVNYGSTTAYGDEVPCRLNVASSSDGIDTVGRLGEQTTGSVTVPLGTDVTAGDWVEVTVSPGGVTTTEVWEVSGTPTNVTYAVSLTFDVRRPE